MLLRRSAWSLHIEHASDYAFKLQYQCLAEQSLASYLESPDGHTIPWCTYQYSWTFICLFRFLVGQSRCNMNKFKFHSSPDLQIERNRCTLRRIQLLFQPPSSTIISYPASFASQTTWATYCQVLFWSWTHWCQISSPSFQVTCSYNYDRPFWIRQS